MSKHKKKKKTQNKEKIDIQKTKKELKEEIRELQIQKFNLHELANKLAKEKYEKGLEAPDKMLLRRSVLEGPELYEEIQKKQKKLKELEKK